jgi:hypothetical protein
VFQLPRPKIATELRQIQINSDEIFKLSIKQFRSSLFTSMVRKSFTKF